MVTSNTQSICACCNKPISVEDSSIACPSCQTLHHQHCWEQYGGCQKGTCYSYSAQHNEEPTIALRHVPNYSKSPYFPWLIGIGIILLLLLAGFLADMFGVPLKVILTISVVIAALAFDYVNGMHDAGNAIATVISTRVLSPVSALVMAAVLNLFGAMVYSGVAASIATKFASAHVDPTSITPVMILCGLLGASAWSFWTARIGLPVSTSHSLFGGLIGVFLLGNIKLNTTYIGQLGMWMVLAPLLAFFVAWLLMLLLVRLFRHSTPAKVNRHFRLLQLLSSALMAFSHGSNDAQKAMGIITMALLSSGFMHVAAGVPVAIPLWVKIACALVIALGTGLGGMRVIRTLGHKIIKLDPIHGFAAETVASATIQLVTLLHIPISTTHVISSSILGIGASKRSSAVRWGMAINIVAAWFFTIPTCAIAGAALYWIVTMVTGIK